MSWRCEAEVELGVSHAGATRNGNGFQFQRLIDLGLDLGLPSATPRFYSCLRFDRPIPKLQI